MLSTLIAFALTVTLRLMLSLILMAAAFLLTLSDNIGGVPYAQLFPVVALLSCLFDYAFQMPSPEEE